MGKGYAEIKRAGDTVIKGQPCAVLQSKQVLASIDPNGKTHISTYDLDDEFMFEKDGAVFWYTNDSFFKLYDFNAEAGDTMYIPGRDLGPECDTSGLMVVDTVGTENINGQNLKYYTMRLADTDGWKIRGRIYERLGPLYCMFPTGPDCNIVDYTFPNPLRCYSDNTFEEYKRGKDDCDFTIGVNDDARVKPQITIYPNPAHDKIFISDANPTVAVTVLDLLGRELNGCTYNPAERSVSVTTLPAGIYLLRIGEESGSGSIIRFVKN